MFRRKKKPKPDALQLIAKPTYAGSNANTLRNVGGAYGFASGVTAGITIGGATGAIVGVFAMGVGVLVTTPVGMVIGGLIGGSSGVGLGRYVGKKCEKKAAEEQKKIFGLQAKDTMVQDIILADLKEDICSMGLLITWLVEEKVISHTKTHLFNRVDDQLFSDAQKQFYNTLLDQEILQRDLASHRSLVASCSHPLEYYDISKNMKRELARLKLKASHLKITLMLEEKEYVLSGSQQSFLKQISFKNSLDKKPEPLDDLVIHVLNGADKETCLFLLHQINEKPHDTGKGLSLFDSVSEKKPVIWHVMKPSK